MKVPLLVIIIKYNSFFPTDGRLKVIPKNYLGSLTIWQLNTTFKILFLFQVNLDVQSIKCEVMRILKVTSLKV